MLDDKNVNTFKYVLPTLLMVALTVVILHSSSGLHSNGGIPHENILRTAGVAGPNDSTQFVEMKVDERTLQAILKIASSDLKAYLAHQSLEDGSHVIKLPYKMVDTLIKALASHKDQFPAFSAAVQTPEIILRLESLYFSAGSANASYELNEIKLKFDNEMRLELSKHVSETTSAKLNYFPDNDKPEILILRKEDWSSVVVDLANVQDAAKGKESSQSKEFYQNFVKIQRLLDHSSRLAGIDIYKDEKIMEMMNNKMKQAMEASNVAFDLRGVIHDDEDVALQGVKLRSSRSVVGGSDMARPTRTHLISNQTVDGTFSVKVDRALSVTLEFSKDGYYDKKFTAPYDLKGSPHEIQIVMQKKRNPVPLYTLSAAIERNADGSGILINFDKLQTAPRIQSTAPLQNHEYFIPFKSLEGVVADVPHEIYLSLPLTQDGSIDVVEQTRKPNDGRMLPRYVDIAMRHPEDGFIVVKSGWISGDDEINPVEFIRDMHTAPQKGYAQSFRLEEPSLRGTAFFYFKTNNYYGKGELRDFNIPKRSQKGTAHMILYIQPIQGSRSVEKNN